MKLLPTWPGWLIDVPVVDESKLGWRRIVDDVIDGSALASVLDALMILFVVMYPSRPGWS